MIALGIAALLLAGAYLLGGALGDNGEEVRAEAKKGYREGFDKGRGRGYRATYERARGRAESATAAAQATAAAPSAPTTPDSSATGEPDPDASSGEDDGPDTSGEGDGSDNCDNAGLGFSVGDCPTDEEIEEIDTAEAICGSPASDAEKREDAARRTGDPDLCGP